MDLNLKGKKAFVAGGSRGMGKAIAKVLAEEGVDVAIAARDIERLENAANDIRKNTNTKVVPISFDTGDKESVDSAI